MALHPGRRPAWPAASTSAASKQPRPWRRYGADIVPAASTRRAGHDGFQVGGVFSRRKSGVHEVGRKGQRAPRHEGPGAQRQHACAPRSQSAHSAFLTHLTHPPRQLPGKVVGILKSSPNRDDVEVLVSVAKFTDVPSPDRPGKKQKVGCCFADSHAHAHAHAFALRVAPAKGFCVRARVLLPVRAHPSCARSATQTQPSS